MKENIISIENLHKSFPDKPICKNASFGIHRGDKIGLIGINGCGKSTFLKMLVDREPVDEGKITMRNNLKIGYLPQIPELNQEATIFEQIYFSDNPKFVMLRKYHDLLDNLGKQPELQDELAALEQKMIAAGVWEIETRARKYLSILGFEDFTQKVKVLSGGQKRRLDLARMMIDDPDVLILDEPTNHLDIDTIEWFQDFLANFDGSVIFVTHDRYFLDTVSTRIMEIEAGEIRFFDGNYSFYLKQKELLIVDVQRKETRRKAQLSKEMKWLQRGAKARSSKPKNHIDRVKELIDKSYLTTNQDMDISFQSKRMGKTILELNNAGKSYGDKELFQDFNHIFQKMERIGVIGANGCGKTTLLRLITEEVEPDEGKIKQGMNTHFAYFKQDSEDFDKDMSVLDYIRSSADNIRTEDGVLHSASEMLQRFLFEGKMQHSKIRSLSGGERKRLYLLKSLMFGSNFIILDEPTNDLDIQTLEILEDYLDAFRGCLLVVSHDRFFLDRVVDYLFIFEEDKIIKFPGNYSDYLLVKRFKEEEKKELLDANKLAAKQIEKQTKVPSKRLSFNETRELEQLETKMAELEEENSSLTNEIETNAANLKSDDFSRITSRQQDISDELEELEMRWLELEEKKG